ncbi:HNH endonuclease signature motif containing protein [Pseudomonas lini]|uniref:HNH endonuclease signature motif containing protein n=1 Tax=Pseudomonas lini TaxID=163011 RepID=UPI000F4BAF6A|nr:HNH endonuclease signature motif containing protein [Pseudomonas lini]
MKKTLYLRLEQLPDAVSTLREIIVSTFPVLAGAKPGNFKGANPLPKLLIVTPCPACHTDVIDTTAYTAKKIRKGWKTPYCGRACAAIERTKPGRQCPGCGAQLSWSKARPVYCSETCRTKCLGEAVTLPKSPQSLAEFHAQIAQLAPHWIGAKPLTFKRGTVTKSLVLTFPCPVCSEPVTRPMYEMRKAFRRGHVSLTCGHRCTGLLQRVSELCETCGKPIPHVQRDGKAHQTGRRFCSRDCIPKRSELPKKVCPYCETFFLPKSSRAVYCSRSCANRAHAQRMIGEGNSHFKDGTSYSLWFDSMRPLILERDGGCAVCGEFPPRSPIHHLDEDPRNNRADNLILMCPTHHAVHHKSNQTPYLWLADLVKERNLSMTSKWHEQAASLLTKFSSTTVDY